jgi:DNA-binding response OmpR family regulator
MPRAKRVPRILLVNGDNTVQHLRALMLRMEGHRVDTAADLHAARAVLAAARKYDLVIVDVGHFAGPGLDFCEEIKKKYPGQKVLMQVDGNLFIDRDSCPDKVMSKQDGPQQFVAEVERMLQAS